MAAEGRLIDEQLRKLCCAYSCTWACAVAHYLCKVNGKVARGGWLASAAWKERWRGTAPPATLAANGHLECS